jgi:hypothetical protein
VQTFTECCLAVIILDPDKDNSTFHRWSVSMTSHYVARRYPGWGAIFHRSLIISVIVDPNKCTFESTFHGEGPMMSIKTQTDDLGWIGNDLKASIHVTESTFKQLLHTLIHISPLEHVSDAPWRRIRRCPLDITFSACTPKYAFQPNDNWPKGIHLLQNVSGRLSH